MDQKISLICKGRRGLVKLQAPRLLLDEHTSLADFGALSTNFKTDSRKYHDKSQRVRYGVELDTPTGMSACNHLIVFSTRKHDGQFSGARYSYFVVVEVGKLVLLVF